MKTITLPSGKSVSVPSTGDFSMERAIEKMTGHRVYL